MVIDWQEHRARYQGRSVWMVCGGPSVRGFDFSRLGDTVAAINEIGRDIPNLDIWIGNDNLPRNYDAEFWGRDCLKLIRKEQLDRPKCVMRETLEFKSCQQSITRQPAIREDMFFHTEKVMWGAPAITTDGRLTVKKSAMLMAICILYKMGFSEIRLLGCDWSASLDDAYGHSHKEVDETSIRKSTEQFRYMEQWFQQLRPMLERRGCRVLNCTDGGHLEVFERRDWRDVGAKKTPRLPEPTQGGE